MTFSIAGQCDRSGMFGISSITSSIYVASRCSWARASVGAILTQNFTDPSLGPRGLDLVGEGLSAAQVINCRGVEKVDFCKFPSRDANGA